MLYCFVVIFFKAGFDCRRSNIGICFNSPQILEHDDFLNLIGLSNILISGSIIVIGCKVYKSTVTLKHFENKLVIPQNYHSYIIIAALFLKTSNKKYKLTVLKLRMANRFAIMVLNPGARQDCAIKPSLSSAKQMTSSPRFQSQLGIFNR